MLGTVLGALLSLVLFGISYRQTIGARKERSRIANSEIERTLTKRIVLEDLSLSPENLARFIEGKAREHRVRASSLLSPEEQLANVLARVVDDDFLASETRQAVLGRIDALLGAIQSEAVDTTPSAALVDEASAARRRRAQLVVMAASTALVGSFAAVIPALRDESVGSAYVAALGASVVLIAAAVVFARAREADDPESTHESPIQVAARFERDVERALKRAGVKSSKRLDRGLDFVVDANGKRLGIELKAYSRPVPRALLARVAKSALEAGRREGLDEVLIVVPRRLNGASLEGLDVEHVRLVALPELEAILRRHGAR